MADESNNNSSAVDGGSTLPISLPKAAGDSNNHHNSSSSSTAAAVLFKNHSWSPAAIHRDVEWETLRINQRRRLRRSKSLSAAAAADSDVTDDDIKELRACFELGFGFDPDNDLDPKLASAFPALQMYTDVNRQFNQNLSRSSSMEFDSSSNSDSSSNLIIDPNDDPEKVKMRLKLWALVVASSVREASGRELVTA